MDKSAIIIGGGLGGLFTGAILSKEGVRVTVIEKNPTVGGGLQSFTRFGEIFDTGMHIIGGMQEGGNMRRICEYLGIWDKVHIKDVDRDVTDTLYFEEDGKIYNIGQGKEGFVNSLAAEFPEQKDNLMRYVSALYEIVDKMPLYDLRPEPVNLMVAYSEEMTSGTEDFIRHYISDEKLANILAYLNPLYGGMKDTTPIYVHALISVLYINGPSRFAGGSYLFAETLREHIEKHGGEVIVGDAVNLVSCEDKKIASIHTKKGKCLTADYYICAIHPCTFLKLLDDQHVLTKAYRNRLEEIPNSYSALTLNIRLKTGTFRYINHSVFYMDRYDNIWEFGNEQKEWPMGFLVMTPPEINQREYSNKLIVTAPMLWKEVRKWDNSSVGKRGEDYEQWKKECAEKLLDKISNIFPDIREKIESVNIASPLTIRDYYGVKEGAMCGYVKDYKNLALSRVPVATKVSNLFLTGQNCGLHGFCGVPLTAITTCEAILGQNYILNKISR